MKRVQLTLVSLCSNNNSATISSDSSVTNLAVSKMTTKKPCTYERICIYLLIQIDAIAR